MKRVGIALGILAFSYFTGVVVMSIGIGSAFTPINTVMSPLVCPGDVIVPVWTRKDSVMLASGPDIATRWICVDPATGAPKVAGYRTVFTAGAVYGVLVAALLFFFARGLSRHPKTK